MTPFAELLRRAWPIFREAARMRRTLTYSELAGRVGLPLTARSVHRLLLTPLAARGRARGLPDLCALVVRKGAGTPGAGYYDPAAGGDPIDRWADEVARCYAHPWGPEPDPRLLLDGPTGPG